MSCFVHINCSQSHIIAVCPLSLSRCVCAIFVRVKCKISNIFLIVLIFLFYFFFISASPGRKYRQTANYRENRQQCDTHMVAKHKSWSIKSARLQRWNVRTQRHRWMGDGGSAPARHHIHAHGSHSRRQLLFCGPCRKYTWNVSTECNIRARHRRNCKYRKKSLYYSLSV